MSDQSAVAVYTGEFSRNIVKTIRVIELFLLVVRNIRNSRNSLQSVNLEIVRYVP